MANQIVEFESESGEVVTAKLFLPGSDTLVASAPGVGAINRSDVYTASFSSVTFGVYRLICVNSSGVNLGNFWVNINANNGTFIAYDVPNIDSLTESRMANLDSVLISSNPNSRTLTITGGHVPASIHTATTDSIPPEAITAGAVTKLQSGLALETSVAIIIARLGAFAGTGINTVLGFLKSIMSKTVSTPSDVGGTFSASTDSLEAIRDQGDLAWLTNNSGTGARTITVTVSSSGIPLQNATVRFSEGVNSYVSTTNSSGVVVFNLDNATYTVAITKSGYSFAGTTFVVSANSQVSFEMTQIAITPGTGSLTTGYVTALNSLGTPESGVLISVEMTKIPSGSTGIAFDSEVRQIMSSSNGLVTIEGLVKGCTYRIWRGKRSDSTYLIPANASSTYELPSIIGREQ